MWSRAAQEIPDIASLIRATIPDNTGLRSARHVAERTEAWS
jgi:hypothetical protein